MKSLRLLDLIITILFYSMLGIGIITFGVFTLFLFGIDLGVNTSTTFSDKSKITMYLLLFSIFIFYSSYVYSIYLFKQNISSFIEFKLFTNQVIKNFKIMGVIYIASYIISSLIVPLFRQDIKIEIGQDQDFFNFPLNGFVIGLFFLVLSKVFQIAKIQQEQNIELKQENELTI